MSIQSIPPEQYHRDEEQDVPSLSASIANVILQQSPRHAWTQHPRLNPDYAPKAEQKYDLGTVAHALLLEGREAVGVVDADDWRTKDAKALRDAYRAEGRVPLLSRDWDEVRAMCEAVQVQLAMAGITLLQDGTPEQSLFWHEPNGVNCRARVDYLANDYSFCTDIKTTSRSANPERFSRTMFELGYDVQAVFYMRGVERITGVVPEFRLLVCETTPPYAIAVMGLTPAAVELANRKIDYALGVWAECLTSGVWPGYPVRVAYADPPAWQEAAWLERELREVAA